MIANRAVGTGGPKQQSRRDKTLQKASGQLVLDNRQCPPLLIYSERGGTENRTSL
jgi:hypothetical protein